MSIRAFADILIHVESFKNVDLFNQGFYSAWFWVYHMNNEEVSIVTLESVCLAVRNWGKSS